MNQNIIWVMYTSVNRCRINFGVIQCKSLFTLGIDIASFVECGSSQPGGRGRSEVEEVLRHMDKNVVGVVDAVIHGGLVDGKSPSFGIIRGELEALQKLIYSSLKEIIQIST